MDDTAVSALITLLGWQKRLAKLWEEKKDKGVFLCVRQLMKSCWLSYTKDMVWNRGIPESSEDKMDSKFDEKKTDDAHAHTIKLRLGRTVRTIGSALTKYRRLTGFLLTLFTGGLVFLCILFTAKAPDIRFDNEDILAVTSEWSIKTAEKQETARLPVHVDAKAGETVFYSTVLNGDGKVRNSILLRGQHQYIKVYLDGVLLTDFGYGQSSILGDAPYAGWILARLPKDWPGKTLTIEQKAHYDNYAGILSEVYLGSKNALVFTVIKKCLVSMIFNLAIFMTGLLLLGISFLTKSEYTILRIRYLSIFSMITSLWLLLESGGYQLLFGIAPVISNLIFILFGMVPVTCLRFLLTFRGFSEQRYFNGVYLLSIAVFLLQQALQFLGICDYIQSIAGTHLVIILTIGGILVQYLNLIFHKKVTEHAVYISCIAFSVFGLIDIFRFYFGNPSQNSVLFSQFGLFLFFLILSYYTVQRGVLDHESRLRQEFFEHMAFTDLLTGIPNRNAFERMMDQYRTHGIKKHPLILVADLNSLKHINDTLGHARGDEAIMTVAHCLNAVFSGSAFVFRIGGDEFCVISEELDERTVTAKLAEFQTLLEQTAQSKNLLLSVAVGWYQEQGESVDQAFNRADSLMYQNKTKKGQNI